MLGEKFTFYPRRIKELTTKWPLLTKTVKHLGCQQGTHTVVFLKKWSPNLNVRKGGNLQTTSLYKTFIWEQSLNLRKWLKIRLHTSQCLYSHPDEENGHNQIAENSLRSGKIL
jgi:hypothetical protein